MPPHARDFTHRLRTLVAPALTAAGFVFDGSRTFRRLTAGGTRAQIVNFQMGVRSMAGRFTVNLAVYDPDDAPFAAPPAEAIESQCSHRRRMRLGVLIPGPLAAFARLPVIGVVFRPRDRWWRVDDGQGIEVARDATLTVGIAWLEANTSARAGAPGP